METKISTNSLKQPKSIEIVASNNDLLTEILFRLPVEPLTRCKIISKRWQSLITNPNFRRRRNLNPVPAAGLFFLNKLFHTNLLFDYVPFSLKTVAPFSKLNFTYDQFGITIIHSCNGLLLCRSFRATPDTAEYYVYNPTTNQFTTLPIPEGTTTRIRGMSLAFDPTKSPNHYKVVCVRDQNKSVPRRFQVEIYSSRTRAWRTSGQPFISKVSFEKGVYWNNAIHWISKSGWEDGDPVYFNVHHHVLEQMPKLPVDVEYGGVFTYFGESCGHLHFVPFSDEQNQFNVYEMKRDYSEWFVKYNVDLSPLDSSQNLLLYCVCCVVRNEEEDGSFLVVKIPGKFIRYNLLLKTFENLLEFETVPQDAQFASLSITNGFQYIESTDGV